MLKPLARFLGALALLHALAVTAFGLLHYESTQRPSVGGMVDGFHSWAGNLLGIGAEQPAKPLVPAGTSDLDSLRPETSSPLEPPRPGKRSAEADGSVGR